MNSDRIGLGAKILALTVSLLLAMQVFAQTDPLPSWNDGTAKKAIVDFVQATTSRVRGPVSPVRALH